MTKKPLILITNDDSISAPGIKVLTEIANDFGEVWVVAPDGPMSGKGHAISLDVSLRVTEVKSEGPQKEFKVSGTPADCVKLAINKVMPRRPDLILSGINHGSNASVNVIYSGTMSAAVEGALERIPAIGFSLCEYSWEASFETSKPAVRKIIEQVLDHGLASGICLNVNFPRNDKAPYKGIRVCRMAIGNWEEEFDERIDPFGRPYYWLTGKFVNYDNGDDTDIAALDEGYITVVPITVDLTAHREMAALNQWNFED
ncbi:MAG TPA: 5'/3'-nucleotidase SurE [Cryomorphaceae bacterium]|nr:5'/3'-nucleotidase SurE [Cryomorphaceae bacterium]|tara:strand:+ start:537 stop:1310 length:774 start_codon:yes stop_codon:yes gene_type:complete